MRSTNSVLGFPPPELTSEIIACFYRVYNALGYGFLETVYRRALAVELRYSGLTVAEEVPFELYHRGIFIGLYRADQAVEGQVIVECKAGALLDPTGVAQCLNYLHVAKLPLALLLHSGRSQQSNGSSIQGT